MEIVIKNNLIYTNGSFQIPFLFIKEQTVFFPIKLCYTYKYEAVYNN